MYVFIYLLLLLSVISKRSGETRKKCEGNDWKENKLFMDFKR